MNTPVSWLPHVSCVPGESDPAPTSQDTAATQCSAERSPERCQSLKQTTRLGLIWKETRRLRSPLSRVQGSAGRAAPRREDGSAPRSARQQSVWGLETAYSATASNKGALTMATNATQSTARPPPRSGYPPRAAVPL